MINWTYTDEEMEFWPSLRMDVVTFIVYLIDIDSGSDFKISKFLYWMEYGDLRGYTE